eukprot:tig00020682_g12843.t1
MDPPPASSPAECISSCRGLTRRGAHRRHHRCRGAPGPAASPPLPFGLPPVDLPEEETRLAQLVAVTFEDRLVLARLRPLPAGPVPMALQIVHAAPLPRGYTRFEASALSADAGALFVLATRSRKGQSLLVFDLSPGPANLAWTLPPGRLAHPACTLNLRAAIRPRLRTASDGSPGAPPAPVDAHIATCLAASPKNPSLVAVGTRGGATTLLRIPEPFLRMRGPQPYL